MLNKLSYSSQTTIFPKFSPIFTYFSSILLFAFSLQNFAGKIGAALMATAETCIAVN